MQGLCDKIIIGFFFDEKLNYKLIKIKLFNVDNYSTN